MKTVGQENPAVLKQAAREPIRQREGDARIGSASDDGCIHLHVFIVFVDPDFSGITEKRGEIFLLAK